MPGEISEVVGTGKGYSGFTVVPCMAPCPSLWLAQTPPWEAHGVWKAVYKLNIDTWIRQTDRWYKIICTNPQKRLPVTNAFCILANQANGPTFSLKAREEQETFYPIWVILESVWGDGTLPALLQRKGGWGEGGPSPCRAFQRCRSDAWPRPRSALPDWRRSGGLSLSPPHPSSDDSTPLLWWEQDQGKQTILASWWCQQRLLDIW